MVYDVSNDKSFTSVSRWIQHVNELKPGVPLAVVGNKCDLPRAVPTDTARKFCSDFKPAPLDFFEASALDGSGVQQAFSAFVKRMFNSRPKEEPKRATVNPADQKKPQPRQGLCLV